ncbi:glycine--tRNA ligase subunit beta [Alkalimarinus coralli]|uniref:glycine--tRNA ligase subunit beta n=1 Tax=Alkalimarinus coralli TaxID=2935863 RepID=UPI00202B300D|nr:glycine--tRNA ligase subunit beta [Alkalimarinus coralli]
MSAQDFLVEIGTEELPPKALKKLSTAFSDGIQQGLKAANLEFASVELFAAPRRLAVRVNQLSDTQPDTNIEKRGPAAKAAYDADGNPTRALEGFARSCGATVEQLETMETDKGAWLVYRSVQAGQKTTELLPEIVTKSLAQLPIPKRMRWGARRVEFVRPVQWVIMLSGSSVIDCEILGHKAGNQTRGHRFHCNEMLTINVPSEYETTLSEKGYVIADFEARREKVRSSVTAIAETVNGQAVIDEELLDEVTALNEWPVPLIGRFEERFLDVPAEALISSMKEHQKYFHIVDNKGNMLPNFITLSNIESKDPAQVVSGNERVIRPRLADAAFFYETDKKQSLESRVELLKPIVFQKQLGSIYDKVQRTSGLAGKIATAIDGDEQLAKRAGLLLKSDLVSEMVLEFTDLQGIMGMYYAQHDGEPEEVATALNEQYMPRFAGDQLPSTKTGCAVAIADKLDSLVGIFGINQPPTGTKDPFALRRASLGILRIMVEKELKLDLADCIDWSIAQHSELPAAAPVEKLKDTVIDYMLDRFRAWYEEEGIPAEVFLAVHARRPTRPLDFDQRIKAVNQFRQLPEAAALAAANKRVSNILSKVHANDLAATLNNDLLELDAEKELAAAIAEQAEKVSPLFTAGNYGEALQSLASLRPSIDRFFDDVMVMADDEAVKNNRLALLNQLRSLFLSAADISLLSS